jgi:hypothetical protein
VVGHVVEIAFGIGTSRLMVGGTVPSRMARAQTIAPSEPGANEAARAGTSWGPPVRKTS